MTNSQQRRGGGFRAGNICRLRREAFLEALMGAPSPAAAPRRQASEANFRRRPLSGASPNRFHGIERGARPINSCQVCMWRRPVGRAPSIPRGHVVVRLSRNALQRASRRHFGEALTGNRSIPRTDRQSVRTLSYRRSSPFLCNYISRRTRTTLWYISLHRKSRANLSSTYLRAASVQSPNITNFCACIFCFIDISFIKLSCTLYSTCCSLIVSLPVRPPWKLIPTLFHINYFPYVLLTLAATVKKIYIVYMYIYT